VRFRIDDVLSSMDALDQKVLSMFVSLNKETLDLHELFEAGGNDPEARTAVLDKVEHLVKEGLLEERGNDFYALTIKGKMASYE
jgi:hypothetical protein